MNKGLHVLGPLLPPGYGTETQTVEAGSSVDIETFLEGMSVQHGKRSVFFVRDYIFLFLFFTKKTHTNYSRRFHLVPSSIHQFRNTLMN